jgi:hypothetical protein
MRTKNGIRMKPLGLSGHGALKALLSFYTSASGMPRMRRSTTRYLKTNEVQN